MISAMNDTALLASDTAQFLEAFNQGTLGVSFGIAGFLIGYMAGAAYLLLELGIITPTTKVAGASSGALLTMGLCSGISPDAFLSDTYRLSNACRKASNCQGGLGPAVLKTLQEILPPDAYQRCSNKAFMSITVGPFPSRGTAVNKLVTDFSSNADLAAAGHASSYIPVWSGRNAPTTTFRGQPAYDGFFTNSQPCPPGVTACIKINSKNPPWSNQNLDEFFRILSRTAHAGPLRPARLASLPASIAAESAPAAGGGGGTGGASSPQQQQQQQQLSQVQKGATASGSVSAQQQQQHGGPSDIAQAMRKAASLGVDIAPGIYSPTGIPPEVWEELIVLPGDEATNRYLWHLGRRDAQIWARATGLEAAAAAKKAARTYSQG